MEWVWTFRFEIHAAAYVNVGSSGKIHKIINDRKKVSREPQKGEVRTRCETNFEITLAACLYIIRYEYESLLDVCRLTKTHNLNICHELLVNFDNVDRNCANRYFPGRLRVQFARSS